MRCPQLCVPALAQPVVTDFNPNSVGNGTVFQNTLTHGSRFVTAAEVRLLQAGAPDIVGTDVAVISPDTIGADFTGVATRFWDVMVTDLTPQTPRVNSGGQSSAWTVGRRTIRSLA